MSKEAEKSIGEKQQKYSEKKENPKQDPTVHFPGKGKVDFVKPKGSEKKDAPVKIPKRRGRTVMTVVIVSLIVFFLGLGGFLAWTYRDSLGIDFGGFRLGGQASEQQAQQSEEMNEDVEKNSEEIESLHERVEDLELDSETIRSASEYNIDNIEKIELFLKQTDEDGDGISDYDEVTRYQTDPTNADTDGDGYSDGDEVAAGYNPNGEGRLEEVEEDETEVSQKKGEYIGTISLTDINVSSEDVKLTIDENNAVSGSFTMENENLEVFLTTVEGSIEADEEGTSFLVRLASEMIVGSEIDEFNTIFYLALDETSGGYTGAVEFVDSNQAWLNNQKGEVSLKPLEELDISSDVSDNSEENDSPITVPDSIK